MTAPPPKSSSWNTGNIVVLLFVLFAFLGIGIISTLILGSVSGREFSPQSFCVREFSYLRIPGIHSRITSTNLSSTTGNLVCSTAISQHLTAGIGTNVRWDLVEFQIGSGTQTKSEASILLHYIDPAYEGNSWEQWSNNNTNHAKLLWPAIQSLAIHRCYFAIPTLMQTAESTPSLAEFQKEIQRQSLSAIEVAARSAHKAGEVMRAKELAEYGSQLGDSPFLMSLRSEASRAEIDEEPSAAP